MVKNKEITFAALPFLGRALQNNKNVPIRYLNHGHPLKTPYQILFL
jgi:hypothetical protein